MEDARDEGVVVAHSNSFIFGSSRLLNCSRIDPSNCENIRILVASTCWGCFDRVVSEDLVVSGFRACGDCAHS